MIYKLVEFSTGNTYLSSEECSLSQLKKSLRLVNTGAVIRSGKIAYAIACQLPSEAFVKMRGCMAPVKISELTPNQQQAFWRWYCQPGNTHEVSMRVFDDSVRDSSTK